MAETLPIRSISRGIAVLQAINRGQTLSMMEIAHASEVPYPTACRIVQTLLHEGLIEREPARKLYRPTALVQTLAYGFQGQGLLVGAARPHIVALTREVGWPISVTTHVGASMILRDSTHALTSLTFSEYFPGYALPILGCAAGLAYLAHTTAEERDGILRSLELLNPASLSHAHVLMRSPETIADIRRNGYATMTNMLFTENPGKTSSIAVPVPGGEGTAGVLTLAFFASAIRMEEALNRFEAELKRCAQRVAVDLAASQAKRNIKARPSAMLADRSKRRGRLASRRAPSK